MIRAYSVVVADAYSSEGLQRISARAGEFDIIIDDGSHKSSDIVRAFFQYFPRLADGGLFIAEDLHCSYWRDYDGGLHDPLSSMSFFKLLADIVNHEHWGIGDTAGSLLSRFSETLGVNVTDDILAGIHSIEFRNSLCIVSKRPAAENTLGQRVVSGQVAAIDPRFSKLDGTNPIKSDESGNEWSRDARSLAAELSDRTREAETLRERVQALSAEVEVGKAALQQSEIERARAEYDFVAADSARQNSEKELARANERQVALERELERFQTHAGKSRNVVLFGRRFRLDFAIGGEPVFPREFARYIPVADAAKVFVRSIGQAVRRRLRVLAGKPAFDPGQMEDAVPGLAEASRKKA